MRSLFERRDDPAAVLFLADFLPPDTDITKTDFLTFHGAFMRKRCTHLSSDEEEQVNAYIEQQEQLVAEIRDQPWFAEDDYDDKPLLAENRYIQQWVFVLLITDISLTTTLGVLTNYPVWHSVPLMRLRRLQATRQS